MIVRQEHSTRLAGILYIYRKVRFIKFTQVTVLKILTKHFQKFKTNDKKKDILDFG